jgi:long-chain fatty acid transport protein
MGRREEAKFAAKFAAILTAIVAAGFLVSLTTRAGGLEVPDLGTRALGRGTAFAARADDLSAFYYNPAGLSKQDGINVLLGVNLININSGYTRYGSGGCWVDTVGGGFVGNCETTAEQMAVAGDYAGSLLIADPSLDHGVDPSGTSFGSVSSSKSLGALPMIVVGWGNVAHVKGLALALGLLTPSSFGAPSYSKTGAQRYALIDANLLVIYPGVGVSYSPNRYLRVGAVFLSGFGRIRQSQAIRPLPIPRDLYFNEDPGGDAILKVDATDPFIPTGIVGVMSQPLDWLELGVTVKLPAFVNATGDVKYTAPTGEMQTSHLVDGHKNDVTLSEMFPLTLRAGARYVHRRFDVEADFVWEQWSRLQSFEVDMVDTWLNNGMSDMEMPDSKVPKNFRDTYSLRLGSDVELWPENIAVRVGAFFQSSAYPSNLETFNIDFPFDRQFGLSGGVTWHVRVRNKNYFDIHAGYEHVFQPDIVVKRGVVQQQGLPAQNPDGENVPIGNVVNGGKYHVSLDIFGLAIEGHFPL